MEASISRYFVTKDRNKIVKYLRRTLALIMSRTRFGVNPHPKFAWISRASLLETGAISEV